MSTYVKPVAPTEGRLGHLTPEQTEKLQQFWVRLYDIFDGKTQFDQTAPSSFKGQARDAEEAAPVEKKSGWFGRSKAAEPAAEKVAAPAPRFTGAQLQQTFWKLTMMDHPDLILLKVKKKKSEQEWRKLYSSSLESIFFFFFSCENWKYSPCYLFGLFTIH